MGLSLVILKGTRIYFCSKALQSNIWSYTLFVVAIQFVGADVFFKRNPSFSLSLDFLNSTEIESEIFLEFC